MIKYQTRSESTGIKNHESFENAIKAAVDDDTIWKVSYSNLNGKRIRFVRDCNTSLFKKEDLLTASLL